MADNPIITNYISQIVLPSNSDQEDKRLFLIKDTEARSDIDTLQDLTNNLTEAKDKLQNKTNNLQNTINNLNSNLSNNYVKTDFLQNNYSNNDILNQTFLKIADVSGNSIEFVGVIEGNDIPQDGASTPKTIQVNNENITLTAEDKGKLFFHETEEFIWDGNKWIKLGDNSLPSSLGNLAFKNLDDLNLGNYVTQDQLNNLDIDTEITSEDLTAIGIKDLAYKNLEDLKVSGNLSGATYSKVTNVTVPATITSSSSLLAVGPLLNSDIQTTYTPSGNISFDWSNVSDVTPEAQNITYTPAGTINLTLPTYSITLPEYTPEGIIEAETESTSSAVEFDSLSASFNEDEESLVFTNATASASLSGTFNFKGTKVNSQTINVNSSGNSSASFNGTPKNIFIDFPTFSFNQLRNNLTAKFLGSDVNLYAAGHNHNINEINANISTTNANISGQQLTLNLEYNN